MLPKAPYSPEAADGELGDDGGAGNIGAEPVVIVEQGIARRLARSTTVRSSSPPCSVGDHRTSIRRPVAVETLAVDASAPLPSTEGHDPSLERYTGNETAGAAHVFGFAAGHDVSVVAHNVDDGVAAFFPSALL